jgi:HNH endonuclease
MSTTTIGALILRDDWTCAYCKRKMGEASLSSLVFDHVIPRGFPGYSPRPENVVVACQACNMFKGDREVAECFGDAAANEVARRCAIYIGLRGGRRAQELRRLGRELGDRLYPWAADYRAAGAARSLARYHARRAAATAEGICGGRHFPFGGEEKTCKFLGCA